MLGDIHHMSLNKTKIHIKLETVLLGEMLLKNGVFREVIELVKNQLHESLRYVSATPLLPPHSIQQSKQGGAVALSLRPLSPHLYEV